MFQLLPKFSMQLSQKLQITVVRVVAFVFVLFCFVLFLFWFFCYFLFDFDLVFVLLFVCLFLYSFCFVLFSSQIYFLKGVLTSQDFLCWRPYTATLLSNNTKISINHLQMAGLILTCVNILWGNVQGTYLTQWRYIVHVINSNQDHAFYSMTCY